MVRPMATGGATLPPRKKAEIFNLKIKARCIIHIGCNANKLMSLQVVTGRGVGGTLETEIFIITTNATVGSAIVIKSRVRGVAWVAA